MKRKELPDLLSHIEGEHTDMIPKGQSVAHLYYTLKTGKEKGKCVVCKRETNFNEASGKFHRICKDPKCKEDLRNAFKKNMKAVGKEDIMNDPNHQRKMLANRSISGEYKWSDGVKIPYTGSYELDFLQFLDLFMGFGSEDIMSPSPNTYYYEYDGKKRHYIPDVFIVPLNMELEIKDGGSNPNNHGKIQAVDKVKERLKDEVLTSQKNVSYVKVLDKNYTNFVETLMDMKRHLKENGEYAQVFNLGEESRPTIRSYFQKPIAAKESIQEMILNNPHPITLEVIKEDYNVGNDLLKEMDILIESLSTDPDVLLKEIEEMSADECYDINYHGVGDVLKQQGYIDNGSTTPGFTSTFLGNLFLDIVDYLTTDNPNMNVVKEDFCEQFREAIRNGATMEEVKRYERDRKAMEYYFQLLISKMDKNVLFMVDTSNYLKDIVNEAAMNIAGNSMIPVYVVLTHTGTILSNAIKTVTRKDYSHASISFDLSLQNMYSFGRKYKDNPFIGTFVSEDIKSGLFNDVADDATYAIYATFMTEDEYNSIQDRLKYFTEPDTRFTYSFKGLLNYKMGKESDSVNRFFCSQFVDHILSTSRPYFGKHSSMVTPHDYADHKEFYLVDKGILKDYRQKEAEQKVVKIASSIKTVEKTKSEVLYVTLSTSEVEKKEIRNDTGDIQVASTNLLELRNLISENKTGERYYTVIHKDKVKKYVMGSDGSRVFLNLPITFKVENINKI